MFADKMLTTAIPERVLTLCKIVKSSKNGHISYAELKGKMEPDFLGNKSSYFADYYTAAQELGLIGDFDGAVSLIVDPKVVESSNSLRKYANTRLSNFRDGQFFNVTKAYFDLGESVFELEKNVAQWKPVFASVGVHAEADDLRAWRFWFSFLGLGYMHDMFPIPNANVFLKDAIENAGLKKGGRYSFGEFVNAIQPYSEIIINPTSRSFNYGTSCGLRTLHDLGFITLEHILDQDDIWGLYPMELHPIGSTVTNVTING